MDNKTGITETMIAMGLISVLYAGALGGFGALVHYLYLIVKNEDQYKISKMFLYVTMGFFVGLVVNNLTMETLGKSYSGVLLVSGFLFLKILDFIADSGLNILLKSARIKK